MSAGTTMVVCAIGQLKGFLCWLLRFSGGHAASLDWSAWLREFSHGGVAYTTPSGRGRPSAAPASLRMPTLLVACAMLVRVRRVLFAEYLELPTPCLAAVASRELPTPCLSCIAHVSSASHSVWCIRAASLLALTAVPCCSGCCVNRCSLFTRCLCRGVALTATLRMYVMHDASRPCGSFVATSVAL